MGDLTMRRAATAVALGMGLLCAHSGQAADYPVRPIRYVVAFAPGGINDIMARIVAQKLNESWGQPVIVDNRPGAGGNLAAEMVAKATPDGYTFMNISTAHTRCGRKSIGLRARDLLTVAKIGTPTRPGHLAGCPAAQGAGGRAGRPAFLRASAFSSGRASLATERAYCS